MDHTEALTDDDVLVEILRRLEPRDLASCRCVRKAWRALVDARGLLLPHVLPRTLRGLFLNRGNRTFPRFFARPASTQQLPVDGDLSSMPHYGSRTRRIVDHCNGLLLCHDMRSLVVLNPATSRYDDLFWEDDGCDPCLVFDPAVSLDYQVFLVPRQPEKVILNPHHGESEDDSNEDDDSEDNRSPESSPERQSEEEDTSGEQEDQPDLFECPPSSCMLNVFSSTTRQWEKRLFVRTETETNVQLDPTNVQLDLDAQHLRSPWSHNPRATSPVYWRGSLYLHRGDMFLVRLSLSDRNYQVIKIPITIEEWKHARSYIGKSENGVYFATMYATNLLQVWTLMESSEGVDWVSKKHTVFKQTLPANLLPWEASKNLAGIGKTWILVEGNNKIENSDWDSDDDNIVDSQNFSNIFHDSNTMSFLGFHPYKEVVLLQVPIYGEVVAMAYHLNSSKLQYLGTLNSLARLQGLFPYNPCITGRLLKRFRE